MAPNTLGINLNKTRNTSYKIVKNGLRELDRRAEQMISYELHNLYSTPNSIIAIKSQTIKWENT
jgi:hypothetical protein